MPAKRTLNLSGSKGDKQKAKPARKSEETDSEDQGKDEVTPKRKKPVKSTKPVKPTVKRSSATLLDDDDDDEDEGGEDEELFADLEESDGKSKILFIVLAAVVVIVVIFVFILFMNRDKDEEVPADSAATTEQPTEEEPAPEEGPDLSGLGTQDFTQDTTMQNSGTLDEPDLFVQDIHGLTTRVDYTVKSINNVADFVQYTKRRGTWGGGLELYWLDATYQGNKYVVQIPFKYYKELDETGIIPVRMEVLTIQGAAEGQTLTVISYMQLDETTLKTILKQQSK